MSERYQEEEQLLMRIRQGDRAFLNELFRTYWPSFLAFMTQSFGMPEDESREIYTRAFTTFYFNIKDGKLHPPLQSRLKTYLFGIGKNYVYKQYGSVYRQRMQPTEEMESVQKAFQRPEVIDYYEYDWQRDLIRRLLDQVGEPCKELLIMSFVREFSDDAIMERLQVASPVAVRQRRFRCLEKLRSLVQKENVPPEEK